MMLTYESICDKLGFDFMSFSPQVRDTEYDGEDENPFKKLSLEELDFVMDYIKENKAKS